MTDPTHISKIRDKWQQHIREVSRTIDSHSREYTITGEAFHLDSYNSLVRYMHSLKQYIKDQESREAESEGSANGS